MSDLPEHVLSRRGLSGHGLPGHGLPDVLKNYLDIPTMQCKTEGLFIFILLLLAFLAVRLRAKLVNEMN